jgi:hypothetical protein
VASSISTSRGSGLSVTCLTSASNPSVVLPIAETATTT